MKILITGGTGQMGLHLARVLAGSPWDIKSLARADLDIRDVSAVTQTVLDYAPHIIINAAGHTDVDLAEREPEIAFAINCDGVKNLANAAMRVDAFIIHLSTDYVFSGEKNQAYTETDIPQPQTVYGQSKLAGEAALIATSDKYLILRSSWIFGEHGNNFVKKIIAAAHEHTELQVVDDQYGGPTYAGDLANTIVQLITHRQRGARLSGIYHYSGAPYVSWFEFATDIIAAAAGASVFDKPIPQLKKLRSDDCNRSAKRPGNSSLDCSKIACEFAIKPSNWKIALNNISAYNQGVTA